MRCVFPSLLTKVRVGALQNKLPHWYLKLYKPNNKINLGLVSMCALTV